MRTTQYAFILTIQVVVLVAMLAFGVRSIDLVPERIDAPAGADVNPPPAEHGLDDLRGYLAR
ncbi:MAG: hypothetical protein NTV23_10640 [Propionibacteriales bacterium]|nr:hypothetical protein [Propionibacteriales bacterium]